MQLFTRLFLLESSFVSRVYESAGRAKGLLSEREFESSQRLFRECQAQIKVIIERLFKIQTFQISLCLLNVSVPFPNIKRNGQKFVCLPVCLRIKFLMMQLLTTQRKT